MISFEAIIDLIMPMVIMCIGIFLNMLIILVFLRRRFVEQFQPAVSMIVLAINDCMALFAIVGNKQTYWTPQLNELTTQTCKIFTFMMFYFPAVSSWLIAYMSIERVLLTGFENIKIASTLKQKLLCINCIYVWNFLFYADHFVLDTLVIYESGNTTTLICRPLDMLAYDILSYSDMVNSVVLPFATMIACSLIIVRTICQLRTNMETRKTSLDKQFSIIVISLDAFYILLNMPYLMHFLFPTDSIIANDFMAFVALAQFFYNFFIYFIFYKKFRKHLIHLVCNDSLH